MRPWDIYTWDFPEVGLHPAVILGTDARVANKPKVNVVLCSSQRSNQPPNELEVLLDESDGLDWATLCKCDLVFAAPVKQLLRKRGEVSMSRRREIAARVIRGLGLGGL